MKAVVVEIQDGYAALLQDDGIVVKVKNRNYRIGDVVTMKEKKTWLQRKFTAVSAAAAMFVMLMSAGVWAYTTPYYYVSLDVNPSVMMEVNRFERVIGMEAANEDAKEVLEGLDFNNKDVKEAISTAVARIAEAGYLDGEDGQVIIASSSKNTDKAERLAGKLKGAVEEEIAENGEQAEVAAGAMGYEMVQQAKDLGITPGKLNIITNLLGVDLEDENIDEATKEEYLNKPVKELMAEFTAAKRAEGKARAEEGKAKGEEAKNRAEEAKAKAQANRGDDDDPADGEEPQDQNPAGKPEEAGRQQGNAPADTPAAGKKGPNAQDQQDDDPDVNDPDVDDQT